MDRRLITPPKRVVSVPAVWPEARLSRILARSGRFNLSASDMAHGLRLITEQRQAVFHKVGLLHALPLPPSGKEQAHKSEKGDSDERHTAHAHEVDPDVVAIRSDADRLGVCSFARRVEGVQGVEVVLRQAGAVVERRGSQHHRKVARRASPRVVAAAALRPLGELQQGPRDAGLQVGVATGRVERPPFRQACDAPRCCLVGERCEPKRDADLMHCERLEGDAVEARQEDPKVDDVGEDDEDADDPREPLTREEIQQQLVGGLLACSQPGAPEAKHAPSEHPQAEYVAHDVDAKHKRLHVEIFARDRTAEAIIQIVAGVVPQNESNVGLVDCVISHDELAAAPLAACGDRGLVSLRLGSRGGRRYEDLGGGARFGGDLRRRALPRDIVEADVLVVEGPRLEAADEGLLDLLAATERRPARPSHPPGFDEPGPNLLTERRVHRESQLAREPLLAQRVVRQRPARPGLRVSKASHTRESKHEGKRAGGGGAHGHTTALGCRKNHSAAS
eukprot:scaffold37872_cov60-Phaeocystis_antarctica.AAC.2